MVSVWLVNRITKVNYEIAGLLNNKTHIDLNFTSRFSILFSCKNLKFVVQIAQQNELQNRKRYHGRGKGTCR